MKPRGLRLSSPGVSNPKIPCLEHRHPSRTGPVPYLRMLAASRVYLDNFDHIQASWFSEGKKAGQVSLHFGADDFGGTLIDENVHAAAGFVNKASTDEVTRLIQRSWVYPVQRTTIYGNR
jgi:cyclic dehypoxanthinyl futalosine synthase